MWDWVGWVFHTVSFPAPIKPWPLATCFTVNTVYTRKQILLKQAIRSDDVLRVGKNDSFHWGQIFFFFYSSSFFFFGEIYSASLTSSFQVRACWNITGKDKPVQQKMWKERMRRKGGGSLLFFPSSFQTKKGFFKIWSKIYGCVCLCDVRVKNSLLFREINSKCLAGAGGVTGMAAAQRMRVCVCVCVHLRSCLRCSTNGLSVELWMFYRVGWFRVKSCR